MKRFAMGLMWIVTVLSTQAPAGEANVQPPPAEPTDQLMGEYLGTFTPAGGAAIQGCAKVIGLKDNTYRVVLVAAPAGDDKEAILSMDLAKAVLTAGLDGKGADGKVTFAGKAGEADWTGTVAEGKLTATAGGDKGGKFALESYARKSPTLAAKPPAGAVVLLPYEEGKPASLAAWTNDKWVLIDDGSVLVRGGNSLTKQQFGDCKLHVEFRCPYQPDRTGQGRANSGVYLHGKYEVQVLDSFGLKPGGGDCGAIYGVRPPSVNACLPPGQWQTYDIVFEAPKVDAEGNLKQPARFVSVQLNGVIIQQNVPVEKITTAGQGKGHSPTGPLMFQDHGNPVRFRNIWLVETAGKD